MREKNIEKYFAHLCKREITLFMQAYSARTLRTLRVLIRIKFIWFREQL